jgi:hypothetical protein
MAFDYEQATHHRRPPVLDIIVPAVSAPRDGEYPARAEVTATGAHSVPPSKVGFQAAARFSFNDQTRELAYDIRVSGTVSDVGGIYLHRRVNRQNGGVAYVLAKSSSARVTGAVTLTTSEAADLKAGKCYVAVISAKSPRMSARGDLVFS